MMVQGGVLQGASNKSLKYYSVSENTVTLQ